MDLVKDLLGTDFRALDRRGLDLWVGMVARVGPDMLRLPTPCPDWTLHGLIRHQLSQDAGFAAAARGEGARPSAWRGGDLGSDPHAAAAASAGLVTAAFAATGPRDRLHLPEIGDGTTVPAPLAVAFHLLDVVVHAWDAAAAIGAPWEPDDELVEASLRIAAVVPADGRGPGEAFGPAVPAPGGAGPRDRLLAALGRSPSWR
ncbi:TIGR03086 family metal-binding protein [Actinomadura sp. WMMB 499]|uniref:TIGR03086 family metal-binding protein n=1 Tax=Actinomadura sp. WMMB 499 TaxID=1219491 RepID=UPI0012487FA8|nr:TIGR03086 family metal-binding protein [Actinomadura sp. WMMB 499]QFG25705.1 TIGR03086 family protein [Actinomadura sp. WMMB 499]